MTELRTCAHCGTAEGELTEFNGRLYCPDCLDDLTLVCTDCGSGFPLIRENPSQSVTHRKTTRSMHRIHTGRLLTFVPPLCL